MSLNISVHTEKIMLVSAFVLFSLIGPSSCKNEVLESGKPGVTVSILPQKYFLERVSGDYFDIQVMIPPGESPATYDPTPGQMLSLSKSKHYFLVGHLVFENTWIKEMAKQNTETEFIDTSVGVTYEKQDHTGHDHDHGEVEPHIWMSPGNVKTMIKNMVRTLVENYPDQKELFIQNMNEFIKELDSLDKNISMELSGLEYRAFIIYHPALTYFARDYRLKQIPVEREGKEPSARYIRNIIDRARKEHIKLIFLQRQFNQEEARTIEREINGRVIVIDPLEYDWFDQIKAITQALKSQGENRE